MRAPGSAASPGADSVLSVYGDICNEHGGLSHQFIHEAAHAVAALDFEICFTEVKILPVDEWIRFDDDSWVSGGVWPCDDATVWVPNDPVGALKFVLAGSIAEQGAFQHALDGGERGDMLQWVRGAGLARDQMNPAGIEALLGTSYDVVRRETQEWATGRYKAIRAVALALAGAATSEWQVSFAEQWRPLSEDEVRAIAS